MTIIHRRRNDLWRHALGVFYLALGMLCAACDHSKHPFEDRMATLSDAFDMQAQLALDGERHIQDLTYTFICSDSKLTVEEKSHIVGNRNISTHCSFTIDSRGYTTIGFSIDDDDAIMRMDIEPNSANSAVITLNQQRETSSLVASEGLILFEGPNPAFDYVNAVFILGLDDGEQRNAKVNIIDWASGEIRPAEYIYSRRGNTISVAKNAASRPDSEIILADDGVRLSAFTSGREEYTFVSH